MSVHVVSYSVFGNDPFYLIGAEENAKACNHYYPGWECRIYYSSSTVPRSWLAQFTGRNVKLVPMAQRGKFDGLTWRFLPLHDPTVDVWVSRDADSRLSTRERAAVAEWLASGRCGHLMRDHPAHSAVIMAGMFGIDNRLIRDKGVIPDVELLLRKWGQSEDYKGYDQYWLHKCLWPLILNDHIAHDPLCHTRTGAERPFPTAAIYGESQFVGQKIHAGSPLFSSSETVPPRPPEIFTLRRRLPRQVRRPLCYSSTRT